MPTPLEGTFSSTRPGAPVDTDMPLRGNYSFVEDFRRNRVSATKERRAVYGNGWVRATDGRWHALTRARFTADRNPVMNIDAGVTDGRFYLATGGETKNTGTPLREWMRRPPADVPALPPDGEGDGARDAEGGRMDAEPDDGDQS